MFSNYRRHYRNVTQTQFNTFSFDDFPNHGVECKTKVPDLLLKGGLSSLKNSDTVERHGEKF